MQANMAGPQRENELPADFAKFFVFVGMPWTSTSPFDLLRTEKDRQQLIQMGSVCAHFIKR